MEKTSKIVKQLAACFDRLDTKQKSNLKFHLKAKTGILCGRHAYKYVQAGKA